jgi:hypothetical protein
MFVVEIAELSGPRYLDGDAAPAVRHDEEAVARFDPEHVPDLLRDNDLALGSDLGGGQEVRELFLHTAGTLRR